MKKVVHKTRPHLSGLKPDLESRLFNKLIFHIQGTMPYFRGQYHCMKYCLIIIGFFPIWLNAQDCKVKKITDPYTKEVQLSTGFIPLDGASLAINADSKEIDLFFSMDSKEKCFSDGATVVVMYEGQKAKATYHNNGPVNCEGMFHINFKNLATTPTLLQRLISQKITTLQFVNNNNTAKPVVILSLSPEQQQAIMTKGDCLVKEAKSLIK